MLLFDRKINLKIVVEPIVELVLNLIDVYIDSVHLLLVLLLML